MPIVFVCWVSSTTGEGFLGSILGEGISSKLTNSVVLGGSFFLPCDFWGALRLLWGHLQAWLNAPHLGGAMVVKMVFVELVCYVTLATSLSSLYTLSLCAFLNFTITLILPSWFPYIEIVWNFSEKLPKLCFEWIGTSHVPFIEFPWRCQLEQLMWHPISQYWHSILIDIVSWCLFFIPVISTISSFFWLLVLFECTWCCLTSVHGHLFSSHYVFGHLLLSFDV